MDAFIRQTMADTRKAKAIMSLQENSAEVVDFLVGFDFKEWKRLHFTGKASELIENSGDLLTSFSDNR